MQQQEPESESMNPEPEPQYTAADSAGTTADQPADYREGDDEVLEISDEVEAAPITLPAGEYGLNELATIEKFAMSRVAPNDPNDERKYLDIAVAIHHPEFGKVIAKTSRFGLVHTRNEEHTRSKIKQFVADLGVRGVPVGQARSLLLKRNVVVTIALEEFKSTRTGQLERNNTITGIRLVG